MTVLKKWGVFAAAALVLAIFSLAACTKSSNTADTSGGSTVRVIEVGLCNNNPPFEYADTSGNFKGFSYETLAKIDELLPEYDFHFQMVDYDAEAAGIEIGKYQIGSASHFYTEARAKTFLLTDAYLYMEMILIVKPDSTIKSLSDLNGKRLNPLPTYDGMYYVLQNFLKEHPEITIYSDNATYTAADIHSGVASGLYDAGIGVKLAYDAVNKQMDFKLKATDVFDVVGAYFLLNKSETDLQKRINEALAELKDNGWLPALSLKYFNVDVFAEYDSFHPR